MAHIRLQPVNGQDHVSLLLQACLDPLVIADAQSHQFLIALHQMGHTALRNADATRYQGLVHFGHTAVFAKTPLANQGNHFQAEFAMRQRPAPFFFGTVALMKARTAWRDTLTHHGSQFPETRECGDRAMAVIGHPQRLATRLTTLLKRGQRLFMRRFQARGSSSHGPSPVELTCLLLLSGYTCCQVFFAIQPRPWYG